jgi:succinate dehydrogenase / fumarate reductase flavoprotein subunit
MGGLWVDYNLMTTIPGLFSLGESNFSDHGANRLGASALMQGLADGYFVIPYTIGQYLAEGPEKHPTDHAGFREIADEATAKIDKLMSIDGSRPVDDFHRKLGRIMWNQCGMSRTREGLGKAIETIPDLREQFWNDASVAGSAGGLNQVLERAGRIADFLEFGELMCRDAQTREESCGGHFREEHQTSENEARRDDDGFQHVAAWEYKGDGQEPARHTESLEFTEVKVTQRSYK